MLSIILPSASGVKRVPKLFSERLPFGRSAGATGAAARLVRRARRFGSAPSGQAIHRSRIVVVSGRAGVRRRRRFVGAASEAWVVELARLAGSVHADVLNALFLGAARVLAAGRAGIVARDRRMARRALRSGRARRALAAPVGRVAALAFGASLRLAAVRGGVAFGAAARTGYGNAASERGRVASARGARRGLAASGRRVARARRWAIHRIAGARRRVARLARRARTGVGALAGIGVGVASLAWGAAQGGAFGTKPPRRNNPRAWIARPKCKCWIATFRRKNVSSFTNLPTRTLDWLTRSTVTLLAVRTRDRHTSTLRPPLLARRTRAPWGALPIWID